ncbi:MAG: hypothetical protein GWP19_01885 [Planctomycetia bacterium]|nr:hypothetical protein [Planctomycetia bacterium]
MLALFKLENYQYTSLAIVALILTIANYLIFVYLKKGQPTYLKREEKIVLSQIVIDYLLLTTLIHFTGGVDSPFHFFYLFHIIIASVIFERIYPAFIIAGASVILFSVLVMLEYWQIIGHFGNGTKAFNPIDIVFTLSIFYVTIFASTYIGVTLMMRHKKVKDLIFAQNEELEKSKKEKMLFFRFVSHELKSPIIAVQSAINVVLDTLGANLIPKARDMLERGRKRTAQMIEILKDLVSLSYEEDAANHEYEMVIPCDHIPEILDHFRPLAEEKDIELIEDICKQQKGFQLNEFTFEKIITNLISNAVRYTPTGGTVTIKTKIDDNFWYLIISDTGIGISKEEQKHIFEEFYRARNAKSFEAVGTGLGMSIIKKMVEQENGEILLESEVGKGSTFTVRFPLK